MRRFLLALLACAVTLGALAPSVNAQGSAIYPSVQVKQLKWKDWNDPALAMSDTTFLNGAYAEDTTEAISTSDWSWMGPGAGTAGTTNLFVGRVGALATTYIDSLTDTVYVHVEQSFDGIKWSTGATPLKVQASTVFGHVSTGIADNSLLSAPTANFNQAPFVCLNAPLLTTEAAGANVLTAGYWRGAPFLRFRVRTSTASGAKISGLKFFVTYFQR
jgi:hypothetical protein